MVERCNAFGMKPVCDHPSYCKHDARSLFIGQDHHLSHPSNRNNPGHNPAGFTPYRDQWQGLCNYAGGHGSNRRVVVRRWIRPVLENAQQCAERLRVVAASGALAAVSVWSGHGSVAAEAMAAGDPSG
jgi:hypothetical protein